MNCLALLTVLLMAVLSLTGVESYECMKPYLEVAVTADTKKIQVFWRKEDLEPGSWIGIYSAPPSMQDSQQNKLDGFEVKTASGAFVTSLDATVNININFAEKQNMGFFAVYWRKNKNGFNHDDESVTTSRYDTYPDWMTHYWNILKDRPLSKIFIPGTHNSACYEGVQIQHPLFKRELVITQDQNIRQQLAMGIRYLDVSVLRHPQTAEFWVAHSEVPIIRFDEVLRDLVEFVRVTDKEIVILDIHKLTAGFDKDIDHIDFVNYLKAKLTVDGKHLWVPRDKKDKKGKGIWEMKMEDIVKTGGNIIVSYNKRDQQCKSHGGILWYPVKQQWNKKSEKLEDVKKYFNKKISKDKFGKKARAVFPTVSTFENIKLQAQTHAEEIQSWFLDHSFGQHTNILAVDYFRGMGTVRTAFLWNERAGNKCDAKATVDDWYYQHNIIF